MTEGSRLDQAIAMGVPGDAIDFSAMAGITFQDTMLLTTYDHTLGALFEVRRRGPWWVVDVEANRHRLIRPEPRTAPTRPETTLCLVHDLGARDVGARPAVTGPSQAIRLAEDTTSVVKELGCPVTFIVPRAVFDEVRERVAGEEHALGFASDHGLVSPELGPELVQCRGVDQRTRAIGWPMRARPSSGRPSSSVTTSSTGSWSQGRGPMGRRWSSSAAS